ncbi:hypothetical protein C4J81_15595 [Deltaproteobacteria bacterium Smac51]|nr:hypothetical protein C4J81_15595 [Deltaproteobacteria bacterium Smac51]
MTFNNEAIIIKMHDNPTSRDFISLLPITLSMSDYNRTEKISYLPRKLSSQDAPSGSNPSAGDFTYYAPWGNLAIFYRGFGYSNGLIIMGRIDSGLEKLSGMNEDFEARLEVITSAE